MKLGNYIFVLSVFVASFYSCKNVEETQINSSKLNTPYRNTFHDALTMKMIGRSDSAIVLFEKCVLLNPESHASYSALADLYKEAEDFNKAFENAEKAYNLDPTNSYYIKRMARYYFEKGNYETSASYYEKIIAEEKNLEVKFQFTDALIRAKKYKRAIQMIDEMETEVGVNPQFSLTKHDLYIELGQPKEAQAEIDKLLNDSNNLENYQAAAEFYLKTNRLEEAKKIINQMMVIDEKSGIPHMLNADILLRNNAIEASFHSLQKGFLSKDVPNEQKESYSQQLMVFAFNPTNPDAELLKQELGNLFAVADSADQLSVGMKGLYAEYLKETGQPKKASEILKEVVVLNPSDFDAWHNLILLQYDAELYLETSKNAEEAIEYFPSQPFFYLMKGYADYKLNNFENAGDYVFIGRDLVVDDPSLESEFLVLLGMIAGKEGKLDKANTYFEKALEVDNTNVWVYAEKAKVYAQVRGNDDGRAILDEGLRIFPNSAILLDAYGMFYMEEKDYSNAIKMFEKALTYQSFDAEILEHYGDALFLSGKEKDALDIWKESKKRGNYSPVLLKKIEDKKYYEK